MRRGAAAIGLALLLASGCRRADSPVSVDRPARVAPVASIGPRPPGKATPPRAQGLGEPVVAVTDPNVLARLEQAGCDAGTRLSGRATRRASDLTEGALAPLAQAVEADLAADRKRDPAAGVGMRFAHRQFDSRWLRSSDASFELVAVVNRIDRAPFEPGTCGEIRFVYRLRYDVVRDGRSIASRLPMTLNVVDFLTPDPDGGCDEAARAWLRPGGTEDDAAWLVTEGPLAPDRLASRRPKSVEVNVQSVRWPSTVRPNLAGHAEYILRVFRRDANGRLAAAPLENTLDVERIRADAALRRELATWIAAPEHLEAIDEGTVVLPEQFLASHAVSVTPHGLARLKNRVYRSTLGPDDFASASLEGYRTFSSPEALLRRLDGLSCPGCHQSRSIAGFHVLGIDPANLPADAIETPLSSHVLDELARRRAYIAALARGEPPDELRPAAERSRGPFAHCGAKDGPFSDWTCDDGLSCRFHADSEVGTCLSPGPPHIGDPCETGVVTANRDAHRDAARLGPEDRCVGDRVCESNGVGFPAGLCAGDCADLPEHAVCGQIAILSDFNRCIAAQRPFTDCVLEHSRPGALRACSSHAPCRDDYVCARLPKGGGACLPPYFLFQLRVDGHAL